MRVAARGNWSLSKSSELSHVVAMQSLPLVDYYSRRAAEYEGIYRKPERQEAIAELGDWLRALTTDQRVIELACGTGYWTAMIAESARSVLALDASEAVLEIARSKQITPLRVSFIPGDAWNPPKSESPFTTCLAAFFLSHIEKRRLPEFFASVHRTLAPGGRVIFADNRFVPGSSTPISRTDAAGDTFQLRHLEDGSTFEVLKNFPTRAELADLAGPYASEIEIRESNYFWCLTYQSNKGGLFKTDSGSV